MVLTLLGDDRYWLTEKGRKFQIMHKNKNACLVIMQNICIFLKLTKTKVVLYIRILYDLVHVLIFLGSK